MRYWKPRWWCRVFHVEHRGLVRTVLRSARWGNEYQVFDYRCELCNKSLPITRKWRTPK